jgi:hypothetical protein
LTLLAEARGATLIRDPAHIGTGTRRDSAARCDAGNSNEARNCTRRDRASLVRGESPDPLLLADLPRESGCDLREAGLLVARYAEATGGAGAVPAGERRVLDTLRGIRLDGTI